MIKIVNDDIVKLAFTGEYKILIHFCNCFSNYPVYSITDKIFQAFKEAKWVDVKTTKGDVFKLGEFTSVEHKLNDNKKIKIFNLYCQYKHITSFEYTALALGLRNITETLKHYEDKILISSPIPVYGLEKEIFEKIIKSEIDYNDVTIVYPKPIKIK